MKTGINLAAPSRHSRGKQGSACVLLGLFALIALAVSLNNALTLLTPARWWGALWAPDTADVALLAIVLSAVLVNAVGIVGFVGLFAPLLPRLRHSVQPATDGQMLQRQTPGRYPWVWLGAGAVLVPAGVGLSPTLGRNAEGWHWAHGEEMLRLLPWRWRR